MHERWVAILGWRDEPTDAVLEYCEYLRDALKQQRIVLELFRVRWPELGWRRALKELREKAAEARGACFILQYTALNWSRRGFSWRAVSVLRILKKSGARCAVMFHDSGGYPGSRLVDRLRRFVQIRVMQGLVRLADVAIVNVPPENLRWLPAGSRKTVFIPVGANLPSPERISPLPKTAEIRPPAIAVFSLSEGRVGEEEVRAIADGVSYVAEKLGLVRLVVLGRNSEANEPLLRKALAKARTEVVVHGLVAAEDVTRLLQSCDLMLFVRGPISSRRGSAIAGIACGLPVVASEGWETGRPITEAGVVLVPAGARDEFGPALVRVLSDEAYRESLAERSRQAYLHHFSWSVIAAQYLEALRGIRSLTKLPNVRGG
jgi:glycosyltransferase involved in cell wall biosynthesis